MFRITGIRLTLLKANYWLITGITLPLKLNTGIRLIRTFVYDNTFTEKNCYFTLEVCGEGGQIKCTVLKWLSINYNLSRRIKTKRAENHTVAHAKTFH